MSTSTTDSNHITVAMQDVYRDIHDRFPHHFPHLLAILELVQTTHDTFEKREKPALLVERPHYENPQDYECHSIQHDFAGDPFDRFL